MPDEKRDLIPLNEGIFTGLSIEEVEARLEMTLLGVIPPDPGSPCGCNTCYQQEGCGTCNTCWQQGATAN